MNKRIAIVTIGLISILIVFIIIFNPVKKNELETQQSFDVTKKLLVPENLESLFLQDLHNNSQEIFIKDSPYTLLIFSNSECTACESLLEEVYKNKKHFIEKGVNINFLWLSTEQDRNTITQDIIEKVQIYDIETYDHLTISISEYLSLGFKSGPTPLIAIYNSNEKLVFQSYGYSRNMIDMMLSVDKLKEPFIDGL